MRKELICSLAGLGAILLGGFLLVSTASMICVAIIALGASMICVGAGGCLAELMDL